MTERGKRFNEGKRRWSLIDHRVLEPLVDVMQKGSEKYGERNYELGMPIVEIMDSLQRHLVAFRDHKIDHDEESKMHHCAHILSNAYILMYNILFHPDMDNRVKEEDSLEGKLMDYIDKLKKMKINPPKLVEPMPKYNTGGLVERPKEGGILKGISPEQFINQERQNARVRRNS